MGHISVVSARMEMHGSVWREFSEISTHVVST